MLIKKIEKNILDEREEKDLERKRRNFIEQGGSIPKDKKSEWTNINLRMKSDMISKIDVITNTKRIGMNRTSWILEAIQEKLRNEGEDENK